MKRVVSIHQPNYIPYMGILYKIDKSDVHVFLDDAQYSNTGMHDFNCIRSGNNSIRLRIPLERHFKDKINQIRTKDELHWKEDHERKIAKAYKDAPYFNELFPQFKNVLDKEYKNLAEMNEQIILWMMDGFGMDTKIAISSCMNIKTAKEERVLDIVDMFRRPGYKMVYYSGNGAKAYQNKAHFELRDIELKYSDYKPQRYPQVGDGFIHDMSALDYIFNCGFKKPW